MGVQCETIGMHELGRAREFSCYTASIKLILEVILKAMYAQNTVTDVLKS